MGHASFTPEGLAGRFFGVVAPFLPPLPEGGLAAPAEDHVRGLLGAGAALELSRHTYVESAPTPEAWVELYTATFGPIVAIRQGREGNPERVEEFEGEFLQFAREANTGTEAAEYEFEYLLVVA